MSIQRQHIFIMGDFHGDWRGVNAFINKGVRLAEFLYKLLLTPQALRFLKHWKNLNPTAFLVILITSTCM